MKKDIEKKRYEKPAMRVVELQQHQMLAGSGDPVRNTPWWDGEGG